MRVKIFDWLVPFAQSNKNDLAAFMGSITLAVLYLYCWQRWSGIEVPVLLFALAVAAKTAIHVATRAADDSRTVRYIAPSSTKLCPNQSGHQHLDMPPVCLLIRAPDKLSD